MTADQRASAIRKAAALTVLGGVLALAILGVAPIVGALFDAREEVSAARERLAALKAQRGDLAALEGALKAETARGSGRPSVHDLPNSAAGWERVEAQLRTVALGHQAHVAAVRPLRMEDEGALKALRVEASLHVPRDRLTAFLAAVEDTSPALFFERVRLSDERPQGSLSDDDRVEVAATIRALAVIAAPPAQERRR